MCSLLPTSLRCIVLSLALVSLAGCAKGDGGPCQVDGDCQSGLTCVLGSSPRGYCRTPREAAMVDAGQSSDEDAGVIPISEEDAGTVPPGS